MCDPMQKTVVVDTEQFLITYNINATTNTTSSDNEDASQNNSSTSEDKSIDRELESIAIKRYLLYDDLVATIVDYNNENNTPIVEFALAGSEEDKTLPVECGICPNVMPKSKLPKHLKSHIIPGKNRYACIYCDESYKDYKYLAGHSRRHMGIRPYVCENCNIFFSTKQDLRVHNQRRHQVKKHICEICSKTFAQNTMLKRHRESAHENKRRYKCNIDNCDKAYFKNFSLKEHILAVHLGQRRQLTCPFCGFVCLDAHKMARHRKLWHLNQREFECEICNEKFTEISYFDAHKRSIQCRNNTRRREEEGLTQYQPQEEEVDELIPFDVMSLNDDLQQGLQADHENSNLLDINLLQQSETEVILLE